ncbi:MAG: FlgD immunoglobulin-like domain containing protein [Bacteroidota bacterium]
MKAWFCFFLGLFLSFSGILEAQTVTITNASWSNPVDTDVDGYTRSRRLNYTVNSNQSVSVVRKLIVYRNGTIFATWDPTGTVPIGSGTFNLNLDDVGTPGRPQELPHDFYDFRLELRRADNNSLLASREWSNDADLSLQQFETSAEDQVPPLVVTITNGSWSNLVDIDGDGFTRSRRLNFTVNSNQSVTAVRRLIVYRNGTVFNTLDITGTVPIGSGTFNFNIDDVGTPGRPKELPHDFYDFRLELRRADNNTLLASRDWTNDADLSLQHFETAAEDQVPPLVVTITNGSWSNLVDIDGDGFTPSRRLDFTVNATQSVSAVRKMIVYCGDCNTVITWDITGTIPIGSGTFNFNIDDVGTLGRPQELPHRLYNFRLELLRFDNNALLASRDWTNDADLNLQKFELSNEALAVLEPVKVLPKNYDLDQNYPNPFNPSTKISYALPIESNVILKVFNHLGQEVRTLVNDQQSAGFKSVEWNSTNNAGQQVASGVYFYRLEAGGFVHTRKLLLLR